MESYWNPNYSCYQRYYALSVYTPSKSKVLSFFIKQKIHHSAGILKLLHKTVFHFLDLQEVLMNECEHSTQITHINLYFKKMVLNLLLEHLPLHHHCAFLHWFLDFGKPTVPGIWNSTSGIPPRAAADCLTFWLFHVIRNWFSSFCKTGMNTNKSNSLWSLLSDFKMPWIVMYVKKSIYQKSL